MKTNGKREMGRITVDVEISNSQDVSDARGGHLDPAKIRRMTIRALVDSGATRLVLPLAVVKQLGLVMKKDRISVRYADGRKGLRSEVEDVRLRLQGREGLYRAVVEPKRETALIGAIVLEDMDFLVNCVKLCLVPRDPDHIVSEIE